MERAGRVWQTVAQGFAGGHQCCLSLSISSGYAPSVVITGEEQVVLGTATGVRGIDRGRSVVLLGFHLLLLLLRGEGDFGFRCILNCHRPGLATLSFKSAADSKSLLMLSRVDESLQHKRGATCLERGQSEKSNHIMCLKLKTLAHSGRFCSKSLKV